MIAGIDTLLAGLVAVATFAVSQHWFGGEGDDGVDPVATGTNGQPLPKLDEVKQWGPATLLFESAVDFDTPEQLRQPDRHPRHAERAQP
jgi:hypothetical protein